MSAVLRATWTTSQTNDRLERSADRKRAATPSASTACRQDRSRPQFRTRKPKSVNNQGGWGQLIVTGSLLDCGGHAVAGLAQAHADRGDQVQPRMVQALLLDSEQC